MFIKSGKKQKKFGEFNYSAESWKRERRIILKTEHNISRTSRSFLVTNLFGDSKYLYKKKTYCSCLKMENMIKEQQLYLFADRSSSKGLLANKFRLFLAGLGYILLEAIRRICLKVTKNSKENCATIRLKLLKIGAIISRKARNVRISLSSSYPCLFKLETNRIYIS